MPYGCNHSFYKFSNSFIEYEQLTTLETLDIQLMFAYIYIYISLPDDRWVWRIIRSPISRPQEEIDPFLTARRNERVRSAQIPVREFSSPKIVFPEIDSDTNQSFLISGDDETLSSIISVTQPSLSSTFTSTNSLPSSPSEDEHQGPIIINRAGEPQFNEEQPNLGIAHFTIPTRQGSTASVTSQTSNHLLGDPEPLISSYSSLDAEVSEIDFIVNLDGTIRSNSGRSLLNKHVLNPQGNVNEFQPLHIKPLPIDISTLPLESTERAEGIRKLWSSITTRRELAELFDNLSGSTQQNESSNSEPANNLQRPSNTEQPLFIDSVDSHLGVQTEAHQNNQKIFSVRNQQHILNEQHRQLQELIQQQLQLSEPQQTLLQQDSIQQELLFQQQQEFLTPDQIQEELQRQRHQQLVQRLQEQKHLEFLQQVAAEQEDLRIQHEINLQQEKQKLKKQASDVSTVRQNNSSSLVEANRVGKRNNPQAINFFNLPNGLNREVRSRSIKIYIFYDLNMFMTW